MSNRKNCTLRLNTTSVNQYEKIQFKSSEYLRLVLMQKSLESETAKLKKSKEANLLKKQIYIERLKMKKLKLESQIEQKKYEKEFTKRVMELEKIINILTPLLNNDSIKEKVKKSIENLKRFHEVLILKNIKAFQADEEFQLFLKVIENLFDCFSTNKSDFSRAKFFNDVLINIKECEQLIKECKALNETAGENALKLYDELLSKCCAKLEKEMERILK